MSHPKILIVLLNSNGDCLYGTVIARQIKEVDFPGCYLTWMVNNHCRQSIEYNPYIDNIWEIETKNTITIIDEWNELLKIAYDKKSKGEFDHVFCLQIHGDNVLNFDGGIRSSIYRNYPHKITVPQDPIIFLKQTEIDRVAMFAQKNNLSQFKKVVLIECGPQSFKSNLHSDYLLPLLTSISSKNKDVIFILSSNKKILNTNNQIVDGSELTFRENAELTKYCNLFIGCSSGITWLTTSQWAKKLPKVILTNPKNYYASSLIHDHKLAGLPTDDVIEIHTHKNNLNDLKKIILLILDNQFMKAKLNYHKEFSLVNFKFVYHICRDYIRKGDFITPLKSFREVSKRNHFSFKALGYLLKGYLKSPFYVFQKQKVKK
jgi:ADP-heptose:LPS heptosyltransferase